MKQYILIAISLLIACSPIVADNKIFDEGLNTKIKGHTIEERMELLKDPANEHLDMLIVEARFENWIKRGTLKDFSEIRDVLAGNASNKNKYIPSHMYDKYKYLFYSAEQNKVMYCENINAIIFPEFCWSEPLNCADCDKLILEHKYKKLYFDMEVKIGRLSNKQRDIDQHIAQREEYAQKIRQQIGELLLQKRELESQKQKLHIEKQAFSNSHRVVRED